MQRARISLGPLLVLVLALACTPTPEADSSGGGRVAGEAGEHAESDAHGHDEHTVVWVEVERPRDASLLELPARVVAAADSRARIDTPLQGSVVRVSARVGDRVEAGDPLLELRIPAVLEAAAILAGTGKQLDSHGARKARLEELKAAGLVGAGEVFDVESDIGRLSAERRLALATLAAVGIDSKQRGEVLARGTVVITAPISGVVAQIDAVPGEVVDPGELLAQILGRATARIEVSVANELPELLADRPLELEFEGLDGSRVALASKPVASAVEPGLGRTLAWYETADPELKLADGVRGRVLLRSSDPQLFEVPRRSLRLHEGRAWVGRQVAGPSGGGETQMIEVEVLRSVGSVALIRSDALALGDRIAADPATVLLLGRDPEELGGGHQH